MGAEYTARDSVYKPSLPRTTEPTAVTGPDADMDAATKPPARDAEDAVTAPAVTAPVDREATVAAPVVVRTVAVTGPELVRPVTCATAAVMPPVERDVAVSGPTDAEVAESDRAVTAPADDNEPDRSRPVTEAVFACMPPMTVVVLVTSPPRMTPKALAPMRTLPYDAPVPASRTRSPPELRE